MAAWAVGRTVRSWRHQNAALAAANRELEEQRELQAQAAVAVERGRIARELHDVVAHNVSMMVVQAGAAGRVLDGEQPDVRNALEVIAATGRGPDGASITSQGTGTGHGLVGMRERAAMLGGDLEAAPADDGGFTVRARLPLPAPASA